MISILNHTFPNPLDISYIGAITEEEKGVYVFGVVLRSSTGTMLPIRHNKPAELKAAQTALIQHIRDEIKRVNTEGERMMRVAQGGLIGN